MGKHLHARPRRRFGGALTGLVAALALLLLAGCDAVVGPDGIGIGSGAAGRWLDSGWYDYAAWSDFGGSRPAWWGYVELRVDRDGRITGRYELPGQCTDGYGFEATCFGRVDGRVYSDGRVRFGFDEGWLGHDGRVNRHSEVSGRWDTRLLGYTDRGDFELLPRW